MPKKLNYFQNIAKEINDVYQASRRTQEMSNTSGPGTDSAATALRKKQTKQEGQLWGALLQGRRYDNKTGKQIKPKKAK
jgi:very-short-patch-repair endonuclease